MPIDFETAVHVFVQAFCAGKSKYHPYLAARHDDVWVLQDGPGREKDPRAIEVISMNTSPAKAVSLVKELGLARHFIADLRHGHEVDQAVKAEFKSFGYRAMNSEGFYIHDLKDIPHFECDPPVFLVDPANPPKSIWKRGIPSPQNRMHFVGDDDLWIGSVTSVPIAQNAWVSALWVREELRGRGYGRALMSRLLETDKAAGVDTSVLLASHAGMRLYPLLNYQRIGTLQLFCPVKKA